MQGILLRCGDWRNNHARSAQALDLVLDRIATQRLDTAPGAPRVNLMSCPSPVRTLARFEPNSPQHQSLLQDIARFIELHRPPLLIVATHTDCGAYGGQRSFRSEEEEHRILLTDLDKAAAILAQHFPSLRVEKLLMHTGPDSVEQIDWLTSPPQGT